MIRAASVICLPDAARSGETLSHLVSVSHYLNYTPYRECRPFTAENVNVSYGAKLGRCKRAGLKMGGVGDNDQVVAS
jgi:hypothetical protein